jgi:site-specific recombinase XerD
MLFLAAIRTCYKMVYQKDPTVNIYRPKKYVKLPRILTKSEVLRVISKTNKRRDKLILSLMYGCGLRVGEIVNLKVEDINLKRGVGYITRSKVRRERMFVIPKKIRTLLKEHIGSQQNKNLSNLFSNGLINQAQRKLTTRGVQKMVKLAGKRVGVTVHPHLLRHTYATHLLESGTELWRIQRLMGHALMRSTEIYIHTSTKDIEGVKSPLDAS